MGWVGLSVVSWFFCLVFLNAFFFFIWNGEVKVFFWDDFLFRIFKVLQVFIWIVSYVFYLWVLGFVTFCLGFIFSVWICF